MSLDVHLHGERIGTLFAAGEGDYRFAYDPEVVEEVGAGTPLLSNSLPARPDPYSASSTRAYVEGLLPQGPRRERLAAELGVDPADGYALLAEIGRDCAGAVVFLPEGTPLRPLPEEEEEEEEDSWLSEEELEKLVDHRPRRPLTEPRSVQPLRATLAGERHKLALVRDEPAGRWGRPSPGIPSTHVVKPETGEYPGLVANEMFCTEVARRVGLPVPVTEIAEIAGRSCLVSKRFDREGDGPGARRIHQEDFCQALGFPAQIDLTAEELQEAAGYEHEEGEEAEHVFAHEVREADTPRFPESCGLLRALGLAEEVRPLLTAALLNYALGNGDAHGKNFALLLERGGARLAPLYDLTSTLVYDVPTHTGMVIAEDYDETAYLLELAWIAETCECDLDEFRAMAAATAARIGEALEEVAAQAREEGWHAPVIDDIVELASERALGLGYEVEH